MKSTVVVHGWNVHPYKPAFSIIKCILYNVDLWGWTLVYKNGLRTYTSVGGIRRGGDVREREKKGHKWGFSHGRNEFLIWINEWQLCVAR